MQRTVMAFPLAPGKTAGDIAGMLHGFESRRQAGITMERVYLQQNDSGSWILFYIESDNIPAAIQKLATSTVNADSEFRRGLRELTGVELEHLDRDAAAETIAEWNDPAVTSRKEGLAFCFPLTPGRHNIARALGHETYVIRRNELTASRRAWEQSLEVVALEATPVRHLIAFYVEGADPAEANRRFAASRSSFDRWFKSQLGSLLPPECDLNSPLAGMVPLFDSNRLPVAG